MNVIEASALGERHGSTLARRECSLAIPAGHVAALVGPNGAGTSALLNLAVGLSAPSEGSLSVLGGTLPGSQNHDQARNPFFAQARAFLAQRFEKVPFQDRCSATGPGNSIETVPLPAS